MEDEGAVHITRRRVDKQFLLDQLKPYLFTYQNNLKKKNQQTPITQEISYKP